MTLAGDIIRGKALDLLVERADIEPESDAEATDAGAEATETDPDTETEVEETA